MHTYLWGWAPSVHLVCIALELLELHLLSDVSTLHYSKLFTYLVLWVGRGLDIHCVECHNSSSLQSQCMHMMPLPYFAVLRHLRHDLPLRVQLIYIASKSHLLGDGFTTSRPIYCLASLIALSVMAINGYQLVHFLKEDLPQNAVSYSLFPMFMALYYGFALYLMVGPERWLQLYR
jgi:hypothetical protein